MSAENAESILHQQKAETATSHASEISRRRKFRPLTWVQHLLLLALLAGFVGKGFIPAWRQLNSDFPNYYLIARLYHAGYPLARVYEWTWLQRQKDHQAIHQGLVSFTPSTLPSALAILPWSSRPPLEAKHGWLIANLVFLGLVAFLLTRITALGWERITLLMFLTFVPLRENFLLGQEHVLVLLLLTLALWLHCKGSQFLSGASLAVAATLKDLSRSVLDFPLVEETMARRDGTCHRTSQCRRALDLPLWKSRLPSLRPGSTARRPEGGKPRSLQSWLELVDRTPTSSFYFRT